MENSFAITTTFIVYLILMLAIGVYAYQRTKNWCVDYWKMVQTVRSYIAWWILVALLVR